MLLVSGLALGDILLMAAGFAVFLFAGLEYNEIKSAVEAPVVSPGSLRFSVVAGKTESEVIQIHSDRDYEIKLDLDHLSVVPGTIHEGENSVELFYSPVLGSVKKLEEIGFRAMTGYRLFESETWVKVDYLFTSYPRVFPLAAEALSRLAEMSTLGLGSMVLPLFNGGQEYAETRDYQPGDPFRRFDWKATARTARPMVKEYYAEGGGVGTSIVVDGRVDNPISLDEVNHAFLSFILTYASLEETRIGRINDDGIQYYHCDRFDNLLLGVQIALEGRVEEFMDYYMLLDPRGVSRGFAEKALKRSIDTSSLDASGNGIVVSALSGNPARLMRIIDDLNETILYVPTEPWVWKSSLEASYRSKMSHVRLVDRLEKMGVRICYSFDEVLKQVGGLGFV